MSISFVANAQTAEIDSLKQHYWTYQRLKDSIVRAQDAELNKQIHITSESRFKEQENRLLRAENERNQAIIHQQYWSGVAILAILILCIGTSIFLYLANQQKKKVNQELQRQKAKVSTKNRQLVQLNREVIQQNQQLEQLNRVKNQLLSIVSHDVRAPLRSIQGLVTLAKMDALSLRETDFLLDSLSNEVQQTSLMLDNILNWARSQMDGLHVQKYAIDLRSIALENLELYGPLAEKKRLTLECSLEEPFIVNADQEMIKTVVRNLISNAIKFSYPNGSIILSAQKQRSFIQFTVRDTGVGIPSEDLPKLFSETVRTTLGTGQEKGTGLGLQVCKDFIQQHQGNIWVESQQGVGTAFHFTLPTALELVSA